jgi:putative drug exporter of the RND superfamily
MGPLFGKLSTVQENDNSAFLPDSAESTQASKVIAKFNDSENQTLPTLVLYRGAIDADKIAGLNAHLAQFSAKGIGTSNVPISKYLTPGEQSLLSHLKTEKRYL